MNNDCRFIKKQLNTHMRGTVSDPGRRNAVREHIRSCASCREFALEKNLSLLLKKSFNEDAPAPSEKFFKGLHQKIREASITGEQSMFAELFARAGLRLVPAMTVLVLFLSGSLAYFYKDAAGADSNSTIEDIIFFAEDNALSNDLVLAGVFFEEVRCGEK